jgi:hypothetical protein
VGTDRFGGKPGSRSTAGPGHPDEPGWTLGGFAVAICWATLALGGRWRAEPSWIDRLGRIVGVAWMVMGVAAAYGLLREGFP